MEIQKPARFRQSKEALILDFFLLPLGILYSIFVQGVIETWRELESYPRRTYKSWLHTKWFTKQLLSKRSKNG
jgi:hypothetical protein